MTTPHDPPKGRKTTPAPSDFIRARIIDDLAAGKNGGRVVTRFPPEPNGYPHIGHAKSICLNFGIAKDFDGICHLRFDDTNPTTEDMEYVEAMQRDIRWLGFEWDAKFHASDYFEQLYEHAVHLIREGKAYVDSLSGADIREYRGTVTEAGRESPYRDRSVEENLDLFARMRAGEFDDATQVLRAKIDMTANNMLMRDPILYRILRHAHHYRTGDAWCIYPMYDFTHCLSDSIEDITHSLCTLEFENNRELYDWVINHTPVTNQPQQIEFARLNLSYTVVSKRKLLQLVKEDLVSGWDDPRMPTLSGYRRRGYTPASIRNFCNRIGIAKTHNVIDIAQLEFSIREDLNSQAPRVLSVLRPLRVVIENYPEDGAEELEAPYYPHDVPKEGSRKIPFSRVLYIERDDFHEDPPEGYFRLSPGVEVRLRYAYLIRCVDVRRDDAGNIVELRCTYDPDTKGGDAPDGRKVKGTIHWVSAEHSLAAEVRLYDRLFAHENPDSQDADFKTFLNPKSLEVLTDCRVEPAIRGAQPEDNFQFERQGYFAVDPDSSDERLVFNRTVTLRDTWAKLTGTDEGRSEEAAEKAARKAAAKALQRQQSLAATDDERPLTPEQETVFANYRDNHGLAAADARLLAADPKLGRFFAAAVDTCGQAQQVANWIVNELLREIKECSVDDLPFSGRELGELVDLICNGTISGKIAKDVFADMLKTGGSPRQIVADKDLQQVTDASLVESLITEVTAAHGDKVAQYRAGKKALLGFFVGQVMQKSKGKANPRLVKDLLETHLDAAE